VNRAPRQPHKHAARGSVFWFSFPRHDAGVWRPNADPSNAPPPETPTAMPIAGPLSEIFAPGHAADRLVQIPPPLFGQVTQKPRHLRCSQLPRMTPPLLRPGTVRVPMKPQITLNPLEIGLFRPQRVVMKTHYLPNLVIQPGLRIRNQHRLRCVCPFQYSPHQRSKWLSTKRKEHFSV
jgi:hypothetical protein